VNLRGIVTYYEPTWKAGFLQDDSGGVFFQVRPGVSFEPGQQIEIIGTPAAGNFSTTLQVTSARILGRVPLPAPVPLPAIGLDATQFDDLRVSIEVALERIDNPTIEGRWIGIADGQRIFLRVPEHGMPAMRPWMRLHVTGVLSVIAVDRKPTGTALQIARPDDVRVLSEPPADLFALPLTPAAEVRRLTNALVASSLVRTRGVVTWQAWGTTLFIQDGDTPLFVRQRDPQAFQPGQVLEVIGVPERDRLGGDIAAQLVRRLDNAPVPPAVPVNVADALSGRFDARRVQMAGTLLRIMRGGDRDLAVIQSGDHTFLARIPASARATENPLPAGSEMALTGVVVTLFNPEGKPENFDLLVARLADIEVRSTPLLSGRRSTVAVVGLGVLATTALLWALGSRRKAAREEQHLRQLERENELQRRYRDLSENASDLIATLDAEGRVTTLNRAGCALVARTGESAPGTLFAEWLHTADRGPFEAALRACLSGDTLAPLEVRVPTPGGTVFLELNIRQLKPGPGLTEIQCIGRDVSARKRMEAAARDAIQRQRVHVENTPLGVIEWNTRQEVSAWNPAAERIFGWTAKEALGRRADFIVPLVARNQVDKAWETVLSLRSGQQSSNENITRDGRLIQCQRGHRRRLAGPGGHHAARHRRPAPGK
jgi:PAS domain S-box-containing protein